MVTKSMILPIVSIIALMLKPHFNISDALQDQIATVISDIILLVISLQGIFKDHHTTPSEPLQTPPNNNPIP